MLVHFLQPSYPPLFEGEEFERLADRESWAGLIREGRRTMLRRCGSGGRGGSGGSGGSVDSGGSGGSGGNGGNGGSGGSVDSGDGHPAQPQSSESSSHNQTTSNSSTSAPLQPNAPSFTASTKWRHLTTKLMKPLARTHKQIHRELGAMLMEFLYVGRNIFFSFFFHSFLVFDSFLFFFNMILTLYFVNIIYLFFIFF